MLLKLAKRSKVTQVGDIDVVRVDIVRENPTLLTLSVVGHNRVCIAAYGLAAFFLFGAVGYTSPIAVNEKHPSYRNPFVRLDLIAEIESGGRASVSGDSGRSLGLYQLSAPVFVEFNKSHKTSYKHHSCALEPRCAHEVASWYLHSRIPQMLRAYKVPVTPSSVILAYNAGIKAARDGRVPPVTRAYLRKYVALGGTL